ncbi:PEP-CTERM sorting domain-containing protein [Coraliomargarita sp. SDUM461004]|uniref:PEP-CTERM sorting domain-containing protein n=1 Tax=Thalassobacterium sedimentorum TaxID=3041258 RepID=A0ABU1AGG3_9BACT|nr:PEP-CTERM sorting domain-containing protein [Coraliomargarita sp. SDUM461004]MDQ8193917.1 PEP-CTERM sorting domain-containing protein [Coraliomargarita sp. SDUM461004]
MKKIPISILTAMLSVSPLMAQSFFDDASTASNFSAFGNMNPVSSDGNVVSLIRSSASEDAGADWLLNGVSSFSLNSSDQQYIVELEASAAIGNGEWRLDIVFFDDQGTYLTERNVRGYSADTIAVSYDISEFSISENLTDADRYFVRLRTQGDLSSGFSFTSINAVPEPGQSALLLGVLAMGALFVRRK